MLFRLCVAGLFMGSAALAGELPQFELVMKNNQFQPAELTVPANTKLRLIVKNEDATPAEFESSDLNREKVIPGHSQASLFVGPLAPGKYAFFDDFHQQTTGVLLVK